MRRKGPLNEPVDLPLTFKEDANAPDNDSEGASSAPSSPISAMKSFTVSAVISAADNAACSFRNCKEHGQLEIISSGPGQQPTIV